MFQGFIRLSFRHFFRYRVYAIISILGLSAGLCAFILISLYINYEYSWDKHNEHYSQIFRIQRVIKNAVQSTDRNNITPHTRGITAKLIENRVPAIEKMALVRDVGELHVSADTANVIRVESGYSSDQSVFEIFTFHFVSGSKENSLAEPYTIILSESLAKQLFPSEPALGKTVVIEKKFRLKVTGVYAGFPANSSFRPAYIGSLSTYDKIEDIRGSLRSDYFTYVRLKKGEDPDIAAEQISAIYSKLDSVKNEELSLCPLSMVYLSYNGNRDYLTVLFLYKSIGIFILLISALNFINLTTAHLSVRSKEVAVRKVFGGNRRRLILQFLSETFIISLISICLAFFLAEYLLPVYNKIINKDLDFSPAFQLQFFVRMVFVAILTGLLSGVYPAIFMTGRKPLDLFRGNVFRTSNDQSLMRKILVMIQFSLTILLIILSLNSSRQLVYALNRNIGFNRENLLYSTISVTHEHTDWEMLRSNILRHEEIEQACIARHIPMISFGYRQIGWEGSSPGEVLTARNNEVSYDFVSAMDMELISGREFSRDIPSDKAGACIINEAMVKACGWKDPLGMKIDDKFEVIGVVKDFHIIDVYNKIEPYYMVLSPDSIAPGAWSMAFRCDPGRLKEARDALLKEIKAFFPEDPFEIRLYNETYLNQRVLVLYRTIKNLVMFFTGLIIFISVIGVLGLITFTIERRTKEISIRKISGSTSGSIFKLFGREHLVLVIVASLFAWPLAYLMLKSIPGTYVIPFRAWPFVAATLIVMLVVFATTFFHILRAARTDPAQTIRYE